MFLWSGAFVHEKTLKTIHNGHCVLQLDPLKVSAYPFPGTKMYGFRVRGAVAWIIAVLRSESGEGEETNFWKHEELFAGARRLSLTLFSFLEPTKTYVFNCVWRTEAPFIYTATAPSLDATRIWLLFHSINGIRAFIIDQYLNRPDTEAQKGESHKGTYWAAANNRMESFASRTLSGRWNEDRNDERVSQIFTLSRHVKSAECVLVCTIKIDKGTDGEVETAALRWIISKFSSLKNEGRTRLPFLYQRMRPLYKQLKPNACWAFRNRLSLVPVTSNALHWTWFSIAFSIFRRQLFFFRSSSMEISVQCVYVEIFYTILVVSLAECCILMMQAQRILYSSNRS